MTEEEAREWITLRFGTIAASRVDEFLSLVAQENGRQNLIAPSTMPQIWTRHALDSAQLLKFSQEGQWVDVGTGGGFPGMIVALLRTAPIILVEPRRRRAEFLQSCVEALGLQHAEVISTKIETVVAKADVISARAVASIEKLLQIGAGCAKGTTRWLFPRGRLTETDRAWVAQHWRGVFHVEQSLTDPASSILVLDGARR